MWVVIFRRSSVALGAALVAAAFFAFYAGSLGGAVAASAEQEGVRVPAIMYHSVLKDPARAGKYVVSPEVFEADLKYLADRGYETVVIADLIAYVEQGTPLPEKPVLITFDDGHLNNVTYIEPILEKYGARAVISVVGKYADRFTEVPDPNPAYAHLTWEDMRLAMERGRFEIQNHSYDLHDSNLRVGAGKLPGETKEQYLGVLSADLLKMQEKLKAASGIEATAFTYPLGRISEDARDFLREHFSATLSCHERVSVITRSPESLYDIGRFNRPSGISTEEFMARILQQ